jgi:lysophospholipase L1-like esterase
MNSPARSVVRVWTLVLIAFLLSGFARQANEKIVVYMIGDSTMADKPLEDNPERGWGQMFGMFFDRSVLVENHARNGRSTRSFLAEKLWEPVVEKLRPGDYVFIQFGHNDQSKEKTDRYTSPEDYRANLVKFVTDTRAREATPILCTPIVRRRFDKRGMFYDVHGVYPDIVRGVARDLEVPLIDMHHRSKQLIEKLGAEESKKIFLWIDPGTYTSLPNGKEDNTALLAVEGLRVLDVDLAKRLKP